jgi:hypothetical protein
LTIVPPEGIPEPQVTESFGATTTVNNDAHIRVWLAQIPADGTYDITTDGKVNGYINPQLAFGRDSSNSTMVWGFAGLLVIGLLELLASIIYAVRRGKRLSPAAAAQPTFNVSDPYSPTDDGVRFEQLKNLAALRDSGALTEAEFQTEKRRILDS